MTAAVLVSRVEFGFVPSGTVSSLRDLGNWKSRADAIEHLRRLVTDLPNANAVLPSLHAFAVFLNTLLEDPNFKISLTTLQIWDALLVKVGAHASPVVGQIVKTLVKKLGDNKHVVRQANMRSVATLYKTLPRETVEALFSAFDDPRTAGGPATARFKEDALCALTRLMLDDKHFPHKQVDPARLVAWLVAAAQSGEVGGGPAGRDAWTTDLTRTRATAVEALALACDRYGKDEVWRLVGVAEGASVGGAACGAALRSTLQRRFSDPRLPRTASDGLIVHCEGATIVLTMPRPEDALGRQLETLPLSVQSSRAASRAGSRIESLGATTKPSGFHASLLKMIGRSPRAPSATMPRSTSSLDSSEDTEAETETETPRRQPRAVTATSLGRAAAAANAKMAATSTPRSGVVTDTTRKPQTGGGDTSVSVSDEECESPDSATEKNRLALRRDGSDGSFGSQPRRAMSPTITGRRPSGPPPGSPANSDAGVKLTALKQRRAGSREGSLRAREGSGGGLMRSTTDLEPAKTFAPGGVSTPNTFARRQNVASPKFPATATTPPPARPSPSASRPARHSSQPLPSVTAKTKTSAQRRLPGSSGSGDISKDKGSSLRNSLVDQNVSPLDDPSTEELLPCPDPELAARASLAGLAKAAAAKPMELDWQEQYESLLELRRLVKHHPDAIKESLHQICAALVPAVDSLRSQIAKIATQLVREMLLFLDKSAVEAELGFLVPPLVKRAGENTWLGDTADELVGDFAKILSTTKVLSALVPHCFHKDPKVRSRVAWHVEECCASADAKTFTGSPQTVLLLEKTFTGVVPLLEDGSLETRTMAKRSLCHLAAVAGPGEFDRLLKKLGDAKSRVAAAVVEKGPPPVPQRGSGAGWTPGRKTPNGTPNASPARSLIGGDELLSQHAFGGRREKEKQNKSDAGLELRSEKFLETLKLLSADLTSTKWDTRLETVVRLEKIACATATANSSSGGTGWEADDQTVVALFDLIVPRLADGNAKVQTRTLECVTQLLPLMRDSTQAALSSLVPGLGGGLGSVNEKTKSAAVDAMASLLANVSPHLLVQHVSHAVSYGAARSVPHMLDVLTELANRVFDQKPTLVSKYALPAAMSVLMNGKGGDAKTACAGLLKTLGEKIGREPLLSHAATRSAAAKAKLQEALLPP